MLKPHANKIYLFIQNNVSWAQKNWSNYIIYFIRFLKRGQSWRRIIQPHPRNGLKGDFVLKVLRFFSIMLVTSLFESMLHSLIIFYIWSGKVLKESRKDWKRGECTAIQHDWMQFDGIQVKPHRTSFTFLKTYVHILNPVYSKGCHWDIKLLKPLVASAHTFARDNYCNFLISTLYIKKSSWKKAIPT